MQSPCEWNNKKGNSWGWTSLSGHMNSNPSTIDLLVGISPDWLRIVVTSDKLPVCPQCWHFLQPEDIDSFEVLIVSKISEPHIVSHYENCTRLKIRLNRFCNWLQIRSQSDSTVCDVFKEKVWKQFVIIFILFYISLEEYHSSNTSWKDCSSNALLLEIWRERADQSFMSHYMCCWSFSMIEQTSRNVNDSQPTQDPPIPMHYMSEWPCMYNIRQNGIFARLLWLPIGTTFDT